MQKVVPNTATFDTSLTPAEERQFRIWKAQYAPDDSGEDYDLRGAFKAGLRPDPATGHWPDTFKKPNHPTFSDESIYAKNAPEKAGHWQGETYVPRSTPSADLIADILSPLAIPRQRKADFWDKIYAARNEGELDLALKRYPLLPSTRSALKEAWTALNPNAEVLKQQAIKYPTQQEQVAAREQNPANLNPGRAARFSNR